MKTLEEIMLWVSQKEDNYCFFQYRRLCKLIFINMSVESR